MPDHASEIQATSSIAPSEETLAQMGMSRELFEKVEQEREEREKSTGIARNNGETLYQEMSQNPEGTFTIVSLAQGGIPISPIHSPEELLPVVKDRLEALKSSGATPPPTEELDAFLEGFAKAALRDGRIKTGFDCFDYISPQGIGNNKTGIDEIKAIISGNPEHQFDATLYLEQLKQESKPEVTVPQIPTNPNETPAPPNKLPPTTSTPGFPPKNSPPLVPIPTPTETPPLPWTPSPQPEPQPPSTPTEGPPAKKSPFDWLRPVPPRPTVNQLIDASNPQDSAS